MYQTTRNIMNFFHRIQYYSNLFLSSKVPKYKREVFNTIDFTQKCVGIKGAKGIGKTTILHQYLKTVKKDKLYISLDNPIIGDLKLLEIVEMAFSMGIKVLAIDEIHYQKDFASDLKTAYDFFDMQIVFSGSSAIALGSADLSRRALVYEIPVLSFREFIELKDNIKLQKYTFDDILTNHQDIAYDIISKIRPLKYFQEYLLFGAYPFFLQSDTNTYLLKLTETINKTIQSDLLYIFNIEISNMQLLKKLLISLCQNPPSSLSITSLSREIGINTRTLYNYISALQKGSLIHLLYYNKKGNAIFQKPDKVLLNNPNLFQILCETNIGTQRESYFVSQLYTHDIKYSKKGDFLVDEKYTFEIGGASKGFKQIKDVQNSFIVADDIEVGYGAKIPLWLFGFLY